MEPGDREQAGASLGVEALREAVERWVRKTTWKRRDLAARLSFEIAPPAGAFHVGLESFTEWRGTEWDERPYFGGSVDGPENGAPPGIWDLQVSPEPLFADRLLQHELPHTSTVRVCARCGGDGRVRCATCGGDGRVRCGSCGGDGRKTETYTEDGKTRTRSVDCPWCTGGTKTCSNCGGDGQVTCNRCDGSGRVRAFLRLDIRFTNNRGERVLEKTDLPDRLIREVSRTTVLCEEAPRLEPMEGAAGDGSAYRGGRVRVSDEVNCAANALLGEHAFGDQHVLHRQRLTVSATAVHEARYRWREATRRLWVYGDEHEVHAPDYPLSIVRIALTSTLAVALAGGLAWAVALAYAGPPRSPYEREPAWPAAEEQEPLVPPPPAGAAGSPWPAGPVPSVGLGPLEDDTGGDELGAFPGQELGPDAGPEPPEDGDPVRRGRRRTR